MTRGAKHHRVVFLVESPFSERDEERFGVRRLLDRGLEVDVWDVSALTLPNSQRQWHSTSNLVRPVKCETIDDVASLSTGLGHHDACILLTAVYGHSGIPGARILAELSQTEATLATITSGHLPNPSLTGRLVCKVRSRSLKLADPTDAMRKVCSKVHARFSHRAVHTHRHLGTVPEWGFHRPLDVIWAGTNVDSVDRALIGPNTLTRYIHTLDYDLLLDVKVKDSSEGQFVLMLDSMGPLHPDLVTFGLKYNLDMPAYSSAVTRHLERVESALSIPALIAAHPRAQPGILENWYGGRQIVYGQTAKLIADSRLAVAAIDSTSIGLAVSMKRPISIVPGIPLLPENRMYLDAYRRSLNLSGGGLRLRGGEWRVPVVDSDAYDRFVSLYLKRPGTPNRHFWDVVADDLLASAPVCDH